MFMADPASSSEVRGVPIPNGALKRPADGRVRVAVVISEGVNVIDLSGPWGVFESVMLLDASGSMSETPFELFTVAESTGVVDSESGLRLVPNYSFADAPAPHVVVIPAQRGSSGIGEWLRRVSKTADVTMSVCTGVFHLARAGLLEGKVVTTHHEFFDKLEREHPNLQVKRGVRFVEGDRISTAAGLTSGTDLALRVVERYFGRAVAQRAADYMEYQGRGWLV
jgi:transcriptional regulator GlxA family with amidase domain